MKDGGLLLGAGMGGLFLNEVSISRKCRERYDAQLMHIFVLVTHCIGVCEISGVKRKEAFQELHSHNAINYEIL